MGIDHVDRMFGRKAEEPEKWNPNGVATMSRLSTINPDGKETLIYDSGGQQFYNRTGWVPVCRQCWGLGFIPGPNGRHITCEDCGYDPVEL